jgi:hypothetical protein
VTPPADSASLLVPIHVDAWAVDSTNQELTTWFEADYTNLEQFTSPISTDVGPRPPVGIHVHWALPDALTRGRKADAAGAAAFPHVPNRWLVARFGVDDGGAPQPFKAWVVQSDATAPGGASDGSAFLDPDKPTYMQAVAGGTTVLEVNQIKLGRTVAIDAWQASPAAAGDPFLTAVGPANPSFAAYMPFANDVFGFVDTDVPAEGTGHTYAYTYLVVGWFSDPAAMDPLRGVGTYVPGVWKDEATWQKQTPAERFETLLDDARWSLTVKTPDAPPDTSLYHGTTVDVGWPVGGTGEPPVDPAKVMIAVGNTSADALAALIGAFADQQGVDDPANKAAWDVAGANLAGLVQATMLDALDIFGTPGASVLMSQRIEDSWFGSAPGGTTWSVVASNPTLAGQQPQAPQLTQAQSAALDKQLGALNLAQRRHDEAARELASKRQTLYGMWLRVGIGGTFGWGEGPQNWGDLAPLLNGGSDGQGGTYAGIYPALIDEVWDALCALRQSAAALPDPHEADKANVWADGNWSFPASTGGGTTTLSALGLGLKAGSDGRFFHPNDPVVMISGANRSQRYGEDGRYNDDGTLTCRLPGQSITGVQVTGQPAVTAAALQAKGLDRNPLAAYTQVPAVPALVTEAYLADPRNAPAMAGAVGGDATALGNGIRSLLDGAPAAGTAWQGTAPVPFALADGSSPAWAPLFLEWEVDYYPTGSGAGDPPRPFAIGDWRFDGQDLHWAGTGFDADDAVGLAGRTLLTPQAPLLFKQKIEDYLKAHTTLDTPQLEALIATVAGWDLLSQSLSGFTEQLLTLTATETFPPFSDMVPAPVACPRPQSGATADIGALIGDEYRYMPMQYSPRTSAVQGAPYISDFYPLRGGFLQFVPTTGIRIVDVFSQTVDLAVPNTADRGFVPVIAQGLRPELPAQVPAGFPSGAAQLPPRVAQDTRLDLRFLANDGSGTDIATSANPNPVCGWLLPNHLDGGIAVYDGNGAMLGELLPLPAPDNWRPRPGDPGSHPPPQQPSGIANAALRSVVESIAGQTPQVFGDVLETIDETLWTVDPLGGRKDQFLSVLFGRPLAVVQAQLGLSLDGDPAFDQTWAALSKPNPSAPPKLVWTRNIGDVEQAPFSVRLGDQDIRADGLIGYYLPSESYATFHTVHRPDDLSSGDAYVRQIVAQAPGKAPVYQGGIALATNAAPVTVTLVLDPRGPVHAFTGILPVTTATLPPHLVEDFVKQLAITFRTGPIVSDPGTLRVPLPGGRHGAWDWVQATPTGWEEDPIVAADDVARLPDALLELREGWLRLADADDS